MLMERWLLRSFLLYSSISREAKFIWGRKINAVTLLFYLNRWTIFLWAVANTTNFVPIYTVQGCAAVIDYSYVLAILLAMIWAGIRVYAISAGSWPLALLVGTLAMVPAGTNIYLNLIKSMISVGVEPFLGVECSENFNVSDAVFNDLPITDRSCAIAAEVIVLLITWYKTWSVKRSADQTGISTPLATMLLKDGTFYFVVLLILSIVQMVGWVTGVKTYFTTPQVAHEHASSASQTSGRPSFVRTLATIAGSGRFASFVDNMGAELVLGDDDPHNVIPQGTRPYSSDCTSMEDESEFGTDNEEGCMAYVAGDPEIGVRRSQAAVVGCEPIVHAI
ncbi:hypothetical protein CERSUDRAFT_77017 [Gelatoporia subvermispora B]|uniref:DUF6533 domain-containing protein n=1 Tax=Ceriporiopsis subvermispora (strain B) TaxID=914234 RepID=M2R267_CERS8|nr:hypothetical protein CERSUDRAFT_77017 [Gelatoporia subvermispora B]